MPDRDRLIFHIDVNSAFLSWTALERLAQGDSVDLRTIPAMSGGSIAPHNGGDGAQIHGISLRQTLQCRPA